MAGKRKSLYLFLFPNTGQIGLDVIQNPNVIKPFDRINGDTVNAHLVVQVVAKDQARFARDRDKVALSHAVAFLNVRLVEVAVKRVQAVAVVDNDNITVDADLANKENLAVVGCEDLGIVDPRDIKAQMHLLADNL